MDCRDRRYRKTYFAVDNRLYAFVQFDRPKIENHLLTPESMKKRKSGFTLSGEPDFFVRCNKVFSSL